MSDQSRGATAVAVAVGVGAVLAAGLYFKSVSDGEREQARRDEQMQSIARDIQSKANLRDCRVAISGWDGGSREKIEMKHSANAETVVNNCRALIALSE